MMQRLWRDSVVYGLATVFSRGLGIILIPLYTRILPPADYGALDMITVVAALVTLVVPLEIGQGLARLWSDEATDAGRRRLAGTTFWFTAAMYALFLAGALLLSPWITWRLLASDGYLAAMQIGLVLMMSNGLLFALQNQLRFELRSKEYAWISVLYGVLVAGLGALLGGGLGFGLVGVLGGQVIGAVLSCVIAYRVLHASMDVTIDRAKLKQLLPFSWPLVFSSIAVYLSLYANRLVLNALSSLDSVGLFAVGQRVASLITLMIVGVQGALTPLIYAHYKEPATPAMLARIFSAFVAVSLLACLGLALFAPELVRIFAPPIYAPAAGLVAILAPACLLSQMYIFSPGIALEKKTHWQFAVCLVGAVLCVGLSALLVPWLGGAGAAWASLLSAAGFLLVWMVVGQRWYPVPFDWQRIMAGFALLVAGILAGQFLQGLSMSLLGSLLLRAVLLPIMALGLLLLGLVDIGAIRQALRRRRAAS